MLPDECHQDHVRTGKILYKLCIGSVELGLSGRVIYIGSVELDLSGRVMYLAWWSLIGQYMDTIWWSLFSRARVVM